MWPFSSKPRKERKTETYFIFVMHLNNRDKFEYNERGNKLRSVHFYVNKEWINLKLGLQPDSLYRYFLPDHAELRDWSQVEFIYENGAHVLVNKEAVSGYALQHVTEIH